MAEGLDTSSRVTIVADNFCRHGAYRMPFHRRAQPLSQPASTAAIAFPSCLSFRRGHAPAAAAALAFLRAASMLQWEFRAIGAYLSGRAAAF